jgi:hypothetical protein
MATEKKLEDDPVYKILVEFFMMVHKGDVNKTAASIEDIASQVQHEGCKLARFGDIVFMLNVAGSRMVEFHAMIGGKHDEAGRMRELDKRLDELMPFLKKNGVLIAYTTMQPGQVEKFKPILDNYKFKEKNVKLQNGEEVVALYISLEG